MKLELSDKFVGNPNWPGHKGGSVTWVDQHGDIRELLIRLFIAEYVGKAHRLDIWPEGECVFFVYKVMDTNVSVLYSAFSISKAYWETMGERLFLPLCAEKQTKNSMYPHKCTICGSNAYIGGLNNCECVNTQCRLYYNRKEKDND